MVSKVKSRKEISDIIRISIRCANNALNTSFYLFLQVIILWFFICYSWIRIYARVKSQLPHYGIS